MGIGPGNKPHPLSLMGRVGTFMSLGCLQEIHMQTFEGRLVKMTKHYFDGNTRSANNNVIQEE